jgi:RNA polymerase subunit RPABC4/transcription elongation factor Spt4
MTRPSEDICHECGVLLGPDDAFPCLCQVRRNYDAWFDYVVQTSEVALDDDTGER